MKNGLVLSFSAAALLALPSIASANTFVTITGDPNALTSNFQNPGNTATYAYDIHTYDNGTDVVVAVSTSDLNAQNLNFANLYFETTADDATTGSNVGFEASSTAVNDAFDPDTGDKYYNLAGFSSTFSDDGTTKTITVVIPNTFFLTDPDGIGFAKTPKGTDVSLHLSQSFGYSVVGGSADYPRPDELGLATISAVNEDPSLRVVPEPAGLTYMAFSGLGLLAEAGRRLRGRKRA
jgi:hypothetical protein